MDKIIFPKTHPAWLDWIGMGLGVLIGLTPWATGQVTESPLLLNIMVVGVFVLALSAFELVQLERWEEFAKIACGVWLAALPFIYGYAESGTLRYWHFVLGGSVLLLALIETWQDWRAREDELAKHGQ